MVWIPSAGITPSGEEHSRNALPMINVRVQGREVRLGADRWWVESAFNRGAQTCMQTYLPEAGEGAAGDARVCGHRVHESRE